MRTPLCVLACALLLGISPLCAQSDAAPAGVGPPPSTRRATAPPQGRITGTILCNDTHKPARGALVILAPVPEEGKNQSPLGGVQNMARAGNDGAYTVEHVAPGEYTAIAFQPGYLNGAEDMMSSNFEKLPVAERRELLRRNGSIVVRGSETATLNLTLERGAILTGRVLFSDGAPATQVTLLLEDAATQPSKEDQAGGMEAFGESVMRSMFTHQSMNTDDQGHFRVSGLKAASYRLAVTQPASTLADESIGGGEDVFGMAGMVPDTHALRFYAGDTTHRSSAKVFVLRAGEQVDGIEITLPVDAFHTVHGSVSAVDGRPLNMGSLTLTDSADETLIFHAKLGRDGTFKLVQVPSGTYTLQITDARIGKVQRPKDVSEDIPDTVFALLPTNAFADGSTSVLVKDDDVSDVNLSLAEVPLPKSESEPQPSSDEQIIVAPHGNP